MHYFLKLDPDPRFSKKLCPDPHFSKNQKLIQAYIEPWRAVEALNSGLKAQNGAIHEGSMIADCHHFYEEQDPDSH
jgi:hypothetical protein